MSKLAYGLIGKSKYKPKNNNKIIRKKKDNSPFVTKSMFEMHFGFPDDDCDVAEYEGGGLESYPEPKIKQTLIDN